MELRQVDLKALQQGIEIGLFVKPPKRFVEPNPLNA